MITYCDSVGCFEEAKYIDDMDNYLCEEHMLQSIDEDGKEPQDFESI